MCIETDWSALEDDFASAPIARSPHAPLTSDQVIMRSLGNATYETRAAEAGHRFEERCPACRGSGSFRSYTGRIVGECFKCKGEGNLLFKNSAETRAKAAESRRLSAEAKINAWIEANADDHAWMVAKAPTFEFAAAMLQALTKYHSLSEKQHATVIRLRIADAERAAARKIEAAQRAASAPTVDANRIALAFATAQSNGVKRPKMTLDGFKISLAPITGRNAGALYVVRKDDDQYLGKIAEGRFQRVRECDATTEAHVVRIINDPKGEAIAYGQRTGNCCICSRELTNHVSIDAGIGPICAEKFGW